MILYRIDTKHDEFILSYENVKYYYYLYYFIMWSCLDSIMMVRIIINPGTLLNLLLKSLSHQKFVKFITLDKFPW